MLAEIIRSALDDEALAAGLSTRLSDMKARIERFETSAKRKRELALKAMNEAEIPKLLVADFTASLRHGAPTVEVVEEAKIPAAYWKPQASEARSAGPVGSAQSRHVYRGRGPGTTAPPTQREDQVMAFTDEQREALKAKLRYRHVRTRASNGTPISYVEGWHVIAEANRIFGYDCWDRQTLSPRCLWRETQRGETTCFYTAKVRITVRAGDAMIVREGIGTGTGRSSAAETAHEIALKAAETDATKRALATFGNPFGLALYDKEQRGVTRRHTRTIETDQTTSLPPTHEFELHYSDNRTQRFASTDAFVAAAVQAVRAQATVQAVYAFWEANLNSFAALPRAANRGDDEPMQLIGSALKERVRYLTRSEHDGERQGNVEANGTAGPRQALSAMEPAVDAIAKERVMLRIAEPKRQVSWPSQRNSVSATRPTSRSSPTSPA